MYIHRCLYLDIEIDRYIDMGILIDRYTYVFIYVNIYVYGYGYRYRYIDMYTHI